MKTISETDKRFYIDRLTIRGAGNGLFAKTNLTKGIKIKAVGILIKKNSLSDECTHYADSHKFRVGEYLLIPTGIAGMINHSSKPNLKKVIVGKQLYLQTLRMIEANEELFFRYHPYAQKNFGLL